MAIKPKPRVEKKSIEFENIFVHTPYLFAYFDRDFNFVRVNDAYAAAAQKPREFFVGKNHFDLYPHAENEAIFRKVIKSGEPFMISAKPFEHPDQPERGTTYWDWSLIPIKDREGKVEGLVFSLADVTSRKRAELSLEENEAALKKALEDATQRRREVSALLEGSNAVLRYGDFKTAARAIFDSCKGLIGASAGYIALLSDSGAENEVVFLDPGTLSCSVDPSTPMPIRGLRATTYRTGEVSCENDFKSSSWTKLLPGGHVSLDNVMFAPLIIEGKVVGLLGLANKPGGFTENDQKMAGAFGELAAVALYNNRALESLKSSEERFRAVAQTASDAVITTDGASNIVFWNKGAEKIFGHAAPEITGKHLSAIIPAQFREGHRAGIERVMASGKLSSSGRTVEVVGLRKDGGEFPVELSLAQWTSEEKIFFTGILRDITERKRTEEELNRHRVQLESIVAERTAELIKTNEQLEYEISAHRLAEAEATERGRQFEDLMQIVPIGIAITTFDGRVADANSALLKMFGFESKESIEELSALSFYRDPADRRRFLDSLEKGGVKNFEAVLRRKDGSEFWASMAAIIKDSPAGKQIITVVEDITERRRLDEERLKMQKLESVGLLAGGIAHDFNNALAAILTNISVARMSESPGSSTFSLLSAAEKASLRAKSLTNQLLTFAKGGMPVRKPLSLKDLIIEAADFAVTGSSVKCEYDIEEHLWAAEVDEGQITQVISNLVINACQAMPKGGLIRLEAANAFLGGEDVPPLKRGRYVKVSFRDTGAGIRPQDLPRIFDPYFTTKPGGTGLGLATTYSIVKNHFGHITAESKAGEGSVFHVYLPASGERPSTAEVHKRPSTSSSEGGRVLVMDDETDIRESLGAALALFGYKVSFAGNGEEAVHLYKKAKEKGEGFNVVIMDLTVPGGMGGKEAVEQLKSIDPEVRAIVSSGYSNDPVMSDYTEHGFCGVVIKPFQVEELVRELQKATA